MTWVVKLSFKTELSDPLQGRINVLGVSFCLLSTAKPKRSKLSKKNWS